MKMGDGWWQLSYNDLDSVMIPACIVYADTKYCFVQAPHVHRSKPLVIIDQRDYYIGFRYEFASVNHTGLGLVMQRK